MRRLRYARAAVASEPDAPRSRARSARLSHARVDGIDWYWPADEARPREPTRRRVRLLAPFDPVVWDRRRFELLWGWAYRFEAYTPAAKRTLRLLRAAAAVARRVGGLGERHVPVAGLDVQAQ